MNKEAINKLAADEVASALQKEVKKTIQKMMPKARKMLMDYLNSKEFEKILRTEIKEWTNENVADRYLFDYLSKKQEKRLANKIVSFFLK